MKYWFVPEFLVDCTNSLCYSSQATTLSVEDWLGLKTAYPMTFDLAAHRAMVSKKGSVDLGQNPPKALIELLNSLPIQ